MNMIYFTIKNLNENKAFLAMLGFLLVFSCSKDKKEGNGNGNGDATKYTLTITKPTGGTITSNAGGINCGSKDTTCEAEFSKDSKVTLTAKTDTGYMPTAWQGACDKTAADQPCKLTMDANKSAGKAFLAKPTLAIDPKPINGTLVSDPVGINCGSRDNDCEVEFDKVVEVTLTAMADTGYAPAAWQGACDKTAADQVCKLTMDANKTVGLMFGIDTDGDGVPDTDDVDDDNNGLIEIHNLELFNHIQYNLAGTSHKTAADAEDNRKGAPTKVTDDCTAIVTDTSVYLCGYELMGDLDFAEGASYASGSVNTGWRPLGADGSPATDDPPDMATNEGFVGPTDFAGIFDGNGHSISHLYSKGDGHRGLFRATTSAASIRNLGVVDANLYGSSGANQYIGALVGQNQGSISAVSATGGTVNGGAGDDRVGGLVGYNNGGNITASSVTGSTINGGINSDGGVGGLVGQMDSGTSNIIASHVKDSTVNGNNKVGGLVGRMNQGTNNILASYVKGGTVNGGAGDDRVGGLVGFIANGINTITASFATGAANGGAGDDRVGGLVGSTTLGTSSFTASYATGAANGGTGDDRVGGLLGVMFTGTNTITASYATGATNGGVGNDNVGALVGTVSVNGVGTTNTITHSYGFGSGTKVGMGNDGTAHPSGLSGMGAAKANTLTAPGGGVNTNAAAEWDQIASKTKGAWDFGSGSQAPALKYADYDGAGASSVDYCALFPAKIPGTDDAINCDTTLFPEQRP